MWSTTSAASPPGPPIWPTGSSGSDRPPSPAPPRPASTTAPAAGETTWFGFTREIFRLLGADPARVRPTTSDAFVRPAPRPAYSVLGHDRWAAAGIEPIRDWRAALAEAFPALLAAERHSSQR